MILKTPAIVLKSFDFRETSRIATFFSRDHGKVSGVLKGIRKDPRKFGSSLDQFTINDIVYYQYRNSELHLISQCDLRQFFLPVRQDLKKSLAASYILELVNKIMPVEEENKKVYQLMLDFLTSLETATDISKLVYMFQIKILLYSGFRPHLDTCLKCQKKVEGKARFSLNDGGLVCENCHLSNTNVSFISPGTVSSILHVEKEDWPQILRLNFSLTVKNELKYVLNNFLVYHLGRRLKTERFLP